MSMNLGCRQFELMQTPTYVTYMCYYRYIPGLLDGETIEDFEKNYNGKPFKSIKDHWISIREKYILWLKMYAQDSFNWYPENWKELTDEERDEIMKEKEEDIKYIYDTIKELRSIPKLDFYII